MATQRGDGHRDTSNRGFASMDPEKQRAIAAEGGRAAHAQGVAHEFDSEEARAAGRKGGQARSSSGARAASDRDMQGSDRDMQGSKRDMQGSERGNGMRAGNHANQGREESDSEPRDSRGRFSDDDAGGRGGRGSR